MPVFDLLVLHQYSYVLESDWHSAILSAYHPPSVTPGILLNAVNMLRAVFLLFVLGFVAARTSEDLLTSGRSLLRKPALCSVSSAVKLVQTLVLANFGQCRVQMQAQIETVYLHKFCSAAGSMLGRLSQLRLLGCLVHRVAVLEFGA